MPQDSLLSKLVVSVSTSKHSISELHCRRAELSAAFCGLFIGAASACLLSSQVQAEDAGEAQREELKAYFEGRDNPPEMMEHPLDWMIDQRNAWSHRIGKLGRDVDGFFGGEEAASRRNSSFLRLGAFTVIEHGEPIDFDADVKFRLDLPETKKRFKLVIESRTDEFLNLEERGGKSPERPGDNRDDSSGFLRLLSAPEHWKFNTDLGIRFRLPPDPFARFEAEREWLLLNDWIFRFDQSYYYFNSDGFGHRTQLFFEKDLGDQYFLRFRTQARWIKDDDIWDFSQAATLFHQLTFRSAARYQIAWVGANQPNPRTTQYFISATYRKSIYSDWFFLEVSPALTFSRAEEKEELVPIQTANGLPVDPLDPASRQNFEIVTFSDEPDFKPTPSISIGFEVLFSE